MSQIAPWFHECKGNLWFAPGEQSVDGDVPPARRDGRNGLDLYWVLGKLAIKHADGFHEFQTQVDGETWDVRLNYSKGGIMAREDDAVDGTLYEFQLNIQGYGERKIDYVFRPRFENMRDQEGEEISTPWQHLDADEGVDVHVQGSNIDVDRYPSLLARMLQELAADLGTDLDHRLVDEDAFLGGSIYELERYVRPTRSMTKNLIGPDGAMMSIMMLLADEKGSQAELHIDNEDVVGKNHRLLLEEADAAKLWSHHTRGSQLKSYLPSNPEHFDPDDALYHPKFGALFRKSLTKSGSVRWQDRHDLIKHLDERLLSVMAWSGIPIEAGGTTFVADDHFDASARDDEIPITSDPTPSLQARQEHVLLTTLNEMTPSDEDVVKTLATDGGQHVQELAERTDYSDSTIYRALDRMQGLIESDNGHVRWVSEKLRQEVVGLVENLEEFRDSIADRVGQLVGYDMQQSASSAFDRWCKEYGAEFVREASEHGDDVRVRIDTVLSELKSSTKPHLQTVIEEMFDAWTKDGRDVQLLGEATIEVDVTGKGTVEAPARVLR
jgi:predicted transcriptional regulator